MGWGIKTFIVNSIKDSIRGPTNSALKSFFDQFMFFRCQQYQWQRRERNWEVNNFSNVNGVNSKYTGKKLGDVSNF